MTIGLAFWPNGHIADWDDPYTNGTTLLHPCNNFTKMTDVRRHLRAFAEPIMFLNLYIFWRCGIH